MNCDPPLDGMGHLHPVAEIAEDVVGQDGLAPEVEGGMHGVPALQPVSHVQRRQQGADDVLIAPIGDEVVAHEPAEAQDEPGLGIEP